MKTNLLFVSALLCFQALGCNDAGCPDKHVSVDGSCVLYGSSGGTNAGGAASGGSASGGAATGGAASAKEAAFGDVCAAHADCGGETNYCAMPPGEPAYCTASACDTTPSVCPSGYECFNLGQFAPGEPFICTKIPPVGDGAFGDGCSTHADCKGDTNYCAASPLEPPYCSVSGCDTMAELCPEGWSCFDVGQFVAGEPFICMKPPPSM